MIKNLITPDKFESLEKRVCGPGRLQATLGGHGQPCGLRRPRTAHEMFQHVLGNFNLFV